MSLQVESYKLRSIAKGRFNCLIKDYDYVVCIKSNRLYWLHVEPQVLEVGERVILEYKTERSVI